MGQQAENLPEAWAPAAVRHVGDFARQGTALDGAMPSAKDGEFTCMDAPPVEELCVALACEGVWQLCACICCSVGRAVGHILGGRGTLRLSVLNAQDLNLGMATRQS